MKLHTGENVIDGIPVVVTRRRARHLRVWVKADGTAAMTIPSRGATLAQGAAFLASKWEWVCEARKRGLSRPAPAVRAISASEAMLLQSLLAELHALWADRLGEPATTWKIRRMKTRWGVCNYVQRKITYSLMLAGMPRELVEYVVVHELTHLKAHGHGPRFQAFMDARLPEWRTLRKRLNHLES